MQAFYTPSISCVHAAYILQHTVAAQIFVKAATKHLNVYKKRSVQNTPCLFMVLDLKMGRIIFQD